MFKRKRKLFALLLLSYLFIVTINVLWLFLLVPWASLQYVIVVFSEHTHLLSDVPSFTNIQYTVKQAYGDMGWSFVWDCSIP